LPPSAVPDAPLTKLGREQSRNLREETEDDFQKDAQLIVSSPVRPRSVPSVSSPALADSLFRAHSSAARCRP